MYFIVNFLGRFAGGHGPLAPRVRALHVIIIFECLNLICDHNVLQSTDAYMFMPVCRLFFSGNALNVAGSTVPESGCV